MSPADRVRFGDLEADLRTGELWRAGARVRIQDLPFRLLAALLERPGELVTRAELGQRLWGGDTFVDFEAGLNTAVAKLREAIGDQDATIIQTVPKRGYRLMIGVSDGLAPSADRGRDASRSGREASREGLEASRDGLGPSVHGRAASRDGRTAHADGPRPSSAAESPSGDASRPSGEASRPSGEASRPSGAGSSPSGAASSPSGASSSPSRTAPRPFRRAMVAALLSITVVAALSFWWLTASAPLRVAVVLFDNETERTEFDRLAQTLTDSVVLKLGGDSKLAVIGNAPILRTDRPFRDLQAIRAAVNADFIVIGQVQAKAEGYRVVTHLIRAKDDAHVWIKETLFATGAEPALERDVVDPLAVAISKAPGS